MRSSCPAIIGRNWWPHIQPGGFSEAFTSPRIGTMGRESAVQRRRAPSPDKEMREAANRVLERRVELPQGGV